ncbi:protein rapunzel-like [Engraulis encrasicolus]|uniref:protein rapunzel-like n=1 Tax=Engraulis encrasicolus TaxID=184585 RepID=UPI002FD20D5A
MADQLRRLLGGMEPVMDLFEQGAEMVAVAVIDLSPVFKVASQIVQLALGNVESEEAEYTRQQFQKVRDSLEVASEEVQRINAEIKMRVADATYFSVEENLTNQFRKYMDILKAEPKFREVKKKLFLEHFNRTRGDKNLITLFNAVTGDNFLGESVLEIVLNYEQKSRRPVEDFCARLKKLFCIGLIALMGYNALKGGDDEEDLFRKWGGKMKDVQSEMTSVIEDCINSYPEQAKIDVERVVRDNGEKSNKELADMIIETLKKKYDWVRWSVRVFHPPTGLFNWGEPHHFTGHRSRSRFQVTSTTDEDMKVMVSHSASPEPLDKEKIQRLIASHSNKSIDKIAQLLLDNVPVSVVQIMKVSCQDVICLFSFTEELHYWEERKNFYVCVHSA